VGNKGASKRALTYVDDFCSGVFTLGDAPEDWFSQAAMLNPQHRGEVHSRFGSTDELPFLFFILRNIRTALT
jgi:hypothetical protein